MKLAMTVNQKCIILSYYFISLDYHLEIIKSIQLSAAYLIIQVYITSCKAQK